MLIASRNVGFSPTPLMTDTFSIGLLPPPLHLSPPPPPPPHAPYEVAVLVSRLPNRFVTVTGGEGGRGGGEGGGGREGGNPFMTENLLCVLWFTRASF